MTHRRAVQLALVFILSVETPLWTAWAPISEDIPTAFKTYPGNLGFTHDTGLRNPNGWLADYRISNPGYLVSHRSDGGELLNESVYRYDFYLALRSGHLGGLLSRANDVVRVEAYDATAREVVNDRTFQMADFPSMSRTPVCRSLTFSTIGRAGHRWEPRVYWAGLSGVFLQRIAIRDLGRPSDRALAVKADAFEKLMIDHFLDHHFVVVRSQDGSPEDLGDAAIWTGLYAASEGWRYRSTHSIVARRQMERTLWAMHRLHAEAPQIGTMVRHVDGDGHVLPDAPSKDTYTGFFFAVGQCFPLIHDPELRRALQSDTAELADALITQDLSLHSPFGNPVNMNPAFSQDALTEGLSELRHDPVLAKHWIHILKALRWYFWLHGQMPVPILGRMITQLKHPSSSANITLTQALNDLVQMLRQLQRNVHHSAAAGITSGLPDAPYVKLDLLLLQTLRQIDTLTHHQPISDPADVPVLPAQALHALHWIKVASDVLPKPNRFDDYYQHNLTDGHALLQTVVYWSHMDELVLGAALGETKASAMRNGSSHLGFLALYDLIDLEKDPWVRFQYQQSFEREMAPMRSDGNAMLWFMQERAGLGPHQAGLGWYQMMRYPVDRRGRGDDYWSVHRREMITLFGGPVAGKAREPVPVDLRPRDAFLWQRSARSIRGDENGWQYPPLDYLFAYWLGRLPPVQPTIEPAR